MFSDSRFSDVEWIEDAASMESLVATIACLVHSNEDRSRGASIKAVASLDPEAVTPFHSSSIPPISVVAYAKRLVRYCKSGNAAIVLGTVLLARYLKANREQLTPLTLHRLLLASVVVAIKGHYDIYYSNAYYAQVGGVSPKEMNRLELALLKGLHFSVNVHADELPSLQILSGIGRKIPLDANSNIIDLGATNVNEIRDALLNGARSVLPIGVSPMKQVRRSTSPKQVFEFSPPLPITVSQSPASVFECDFHAPDLRKSRFPSTSNTSWQTSRRQSGAAQSDVAE